MKRKSITGILFFLTIKKNYFAKRIIKTDLASARATSRTKQKNTAPVKQLMLQMPRNDFCTILFFKKKYSRCPASKP
jgi:hypothetical protein